MTLHPYWCCRFCWVWKLYLCPCYANPWQTKMSENEPDTNSIIMWQNNWESWGCAVPSSGLAKPSLPKFAIVFHLTTNFVFFHLQKLVHLSCSKLGFPWWLLGSWGSTNNFQVFPGLGRTERDFSDVLVSTRLPKNTPSDTMWKTPYIRWEHSKWEYLYMRPWKSLIQQVLLFHS